MLAIFVIAKDVTTQQATFKRLVHDGGRWFLKPLNPAYPIMEIDDPALRVIGRVIESHRDIETLIEGSCPSRQNRPMRRIFFAYCLVHCRVFVYFP